MKMMIHDFDDFDQLLQRIVIKRESQVFDTNLKYGLFLRYILLNGSLDKTLYVSVGEADWVFGFLSRLYQEATIEDNKPKINKLIVLHLSETRAARFEVDNLLPTDFHNRMSFNIKGLQDLSAENHFDFEDIPIDNIPDFHGQMYGDWVLLGKWEIKNGLHHVRTPLTAYYRNNENFELFRKMFIE